MRLIVALLTASGRRLVVDWCDPPLGAYGRVDMRELVLVWNAARQHILRTLQQQA